MAFRAPGQPRPVRRPITLARWPRRLIPVVITVAAVIVAIGVTAGVWTDLLWFRSVGHSQTFDVTYGTKWALFGVAALFMMAVVGLNAWLAYRLRPPGPAGEAVGPRAQGPEAYRLLVDPHRRLVLAAGLGFIGLVSGLGAAGSWRTWLLFANRTSFGRTDPQFHLDISFFVFDYPFLRLLLSYLFAAVLLSVLAAVTVHYLYGGLRPQLRGERATPAARAQLFVLAGTFVLLKAGAYWVDRYAIDFSQRGVVQTGASYTDVNAILPAKTVLAVIALICAALFLIGAARRGSLLPAAGFGLLVLSAVLLGGVYPAIIQQFVVKPNELAKESPFLSKEIASTRTAYGVGTAHAAVIPYPGSSTQQPAQLAREAAALPDLRLADPGVVSPAFQQLHQVKSYYQFAPVLDIDRYQQQGSPVPVDMIVGVRAMSGPPPGQDNWVNRHLVYTHGYGVVAAAAGSAAPDGNPSFTDSGIPEPASGALGKFQPRVYFGEQQASYVIAGGRGQHELDYPNESSGGQQDSTYHGTGGVPVGSVLSRLLYAIKFRQLNIVLSSAINSRSRIMYVRDPLARVAKVAPFLTLDGDSYPIVANQQLYWVVDGYTSSDYYPYSARLGLQQATADTYAPGGAVAGPGGEVNYIRNSVKAVVNAYTGQVTLYQWRGSDPILAAWEKAFPGLIKPYGQIPKAIEAHLRYPVALFALQRQILSQFHETNAPAFYAGQDFWSVPVDPATGSHQQLSQPPYYLTMTMPGQSTPEFSLVTSLTQRGRPNMAAFMAVNSNPASPGYGKIEILKLPQRAGVLGPQQASNEFQSDPAASIELTQLRKGGSKVTLGNLITMPLGGGLLYTQPVYVSADATGSAGSYPALKRVFAYFNNQVGYSSTLQGALAQVLGTAAGQPAAGQPAAGQQGSLQQDLQQAQAYYAQALAALRLSKPDWVAFGDDMAKMNAALGRAAKLTGGAAAGGSGVTPRP
ncbi:MAG TPA: UPF0182 family protein [Streptosporangiaceae bacterium]|nr:UPF0182 family protein [Streptosporangiaceae bacterium]